MEKIDLKKALQIIHGGDWCSLRFLTADVNRGRGGEVIEIAKARLSRTHKANSESPSNYSHVTDTRRPNHREHFTLNMEMFNKKIRKVHPILITHINNIEVL